MENDTNPTDNKALDETWLGDNSSTGQINELPETAIPINNQPPTPQKTVEAPGNQDNIEDMLEPSSPEIATAPLESELPQQEEIEPVKKTSPFITALKLIGIFAGIFVFVYLFLTFPAQYEKVKYWISNFGQSKEPETIELPSDIDTNGSDLLLSTLGDALQTDQPDMPVVEEKSYSIDISDLENNTLIIPKINVKAPIIWNSSPDEDTMLKNLQNGVVHYNGTGLPDQTDGNTFISGHSSYYWWDQGNYKTVFVNLGQLENGDELALAYEDKVYIYKVFNKFEVDPSEVDVLNSVGKPIVSLMTCVPVGTNLRRLIVQAEKVESGDNTKTEPQPTATATPTPTPTSTYTESSGINSTDIINLLPWR